jgi:hypothetical protein
MGNAHDQAVDAEIAENLGLTPHEFDRLGYDVRRIIEDLRLGETFDQYREVRDREPFAGTNSVWVDELRTLASTIVDAFVTVANWDGDEVSPVPTPWMGR